MAASSVVPGSPGSEKISSVVEALRVLAVEPVSANSVAHSVPPGDQILQGIPTQDVPYKLASVERSHMAASGPSVGSPSATAPITDATPDQVCAVVYDEKVFDQILMGLFIVRSREAGLSRPSGGGQEARPRPSVGFVPSSRKGERYHKLVSHPGVIA